MIKFIKYKRNEVEKIDPEGKSLGFADEFTLNDIQCQIAEQKLEGYTCKWNNIVLTINPKGELSNFKQNYIKLINFIKIFCLLLFFYIFIIKGKENYYSIN